MLYQADVIEQPLSRVLQSHATMAADEPERAASWLYASRIVEGILDETEKIDELIVTYAREWNLERMPAIDRAILRVASWELLYNPDIPVAVAIDEAVSLAKEFSTEDSGAYVNGVLGGVARHRPNPTP